MGVSGGRGVGGGRGTDLYDGSTCQTGDGTIGETLQRLTTDNDVTEAQALKPG